MFAQVLGSGVGTRHAMTSAVRKRCGLLMDSDVHGPSNWSPAQAAVRAEGDLVSASIFIADGTGYTAESDWGLKLAELGIEAKVVPAKEASFELAAEALRLVTECEVNVVALAVKEGDFDYLAERIRKGGEAAGCKFSIMEIGSPGWEV
ncbi:unnamed protein product [Polarella glacialis]|uniref:Uncharacterized protein n=1 Tax=Polarella glacialis TaxID=89957 RepID=A0A813ELW5_POLGL|nr:unnamed protein product [Polarella glacialis]CAE8620655.1 unnamed protein product [Polarella glacialis]